MKRIDFRHIMEWSIQKNSDLFEIDDVTFAVSYTIHRADTWMIRQVMSIILGGIKHL